MWTHAATVVALAACALGAATPAALGFANGRVIGGRDAVRGEFPYQVSLQFFSDVFTGHMCGGSIISANYVLTAGHCITEMPPGYYEAVAGEHILNVDEGSEQRVSVVESVVHPDYGVGVGPNDVAVMRVEPAFQFNQYVQPIALPDKGAIPYGVGTLSGWGSVSTSSSPEFPMTLQAASLPILDYPFCATIAVDTPLQNTNICTGPVTGGQGFCSGDSGGPLALKSQSTGGVQLVGIVSWTWTPCGGAMHPSVYTRVSAFVDWIRANSDA